MTQRDLALTFAGGGNRAFYQLGLLQQWGDWLLPRTAGVAACSAGAYVVLTYVAQRWEESWAFWLRAREGTTQNIRCLNLLRGEPIAPHGRVYRATTMSVASELAATAARDGMAALTTHVAA